MSILKKLALAVFAAALVVVIQAAPAKAYSNENMIDNAVFDAKDAMNEAQIRAFIQSRPNTCLTRVGSGLGGGNIFDEPMDYFNYGPNKVDAARVIYKAAQYNEINPKVILATLQKEQSMITDSDCVDGQGFATLNKAMGYACYEGAGACPASWAAGFERQVMKGAWQLAFDRQRADGNTSWGGNDSINYGGRMTEGNRKRCGSCTVIYYDGYSVIDGVNTRMGNGATASLYNYTPHRNQSFPYWFEQFFGSGSTSSEICKVAAPNPAITGITFRKYMYKDLDQANLVIYEGSSTNCIESHTWNVGLQSWASNIATNQPVGPPDQSNVQYGDLNGDGIDEPILVKLSNTASGNIEFNTWDLKMKQWKNSVISTVPQFPSPNTSFWKIVFADTNGDGRDEAVLVMLNGTGSGKIEFHVFNDDMSTFRWHVATQLQSLASMSIGDIAFADLDSNRVDEPVLILYNGTSSGTTEFHTWNPGWASWRFNSTSNLPSFVPGNAFVTFADVDGNRVDEAVLVAVRGTQSGKVEFHTWHQGVSAWRFHTASNQSVL